MEVIAAIVKPPCTRPDCLRRVRGVRVSVAVIGDVMHKFVLPVVHTSMSMEQWLVRCWGGRPFEVGRGREVVVACAIGSSPCTA